MNWNEAQTLMETARDKTKGKPIATNTRLYEIRNRYTLNTGGIGGSEIRLHGNIIMEIFLHHIELSDGGWRTVTTKERLNRYLPRGFRVYQKDWVWYLRDSNNDIDYNFGDVQWIHNDGRVMLYSTHPHYPVEDTPILLPPYETGYYPKEMIE